MGGNTTIISESPPMIALTFDDGPKAGTTERLLDELALREIPATFFVIGENISGNEDLLRRMSQEGHQIGLHSNNHIPLTDLSRKDFDSQIVAPQELLESILPHETFWLRPPYGQLDSSVLLWSDMPIVLWSMDPKDWEDHDVDRIVDMVLSQVADGDIILLHDIYSETVDATLAIADGLMAQGYVFGTVEELMEYRGVTPENGTIYRNFPSNIP